MNIIIRLLLIFITLLGGDAQAQLFTPPLIFSGAAAFAGPGDVVSGGTAFWSCSRAYSSATKGTKACNICLPTDSACADISSDSVTGIVPVPIIDGTTCNNSTHICTVKEFYDQTGNSHNAIQTTIANRAIYVATSLGSALGYAQFTASNSQSYVDSTSLSLSQPYTFISYSQRNGAVTSFGITVATNTTSVNPGIGYANSANLARMGDTSAVTASAIDNAWHSIIGVFSGASSNLVVDGSATSASIGVGGSTGAGFCVGGSGKSPGPSACDSSATYFTGLLAEGIAYATTGFSSLQYANMNSNQASFY